MLTRRMLLSGTGSWPTKYTLLFNGQNGDGFVSIGRATSTDQGVTWTVYGIVIPHASPGQWYSGQAHAPCILWDGSQWVTYFDGYDGTNYRIGRATSADGIAWVMAGGNPLLGLGTAGAFDDAGVIAPEVVYDASHSPAWKMWYVGSKSGGKTTIGYADSSDGLTWTKRGQVIDVGSAGAVDDDGVGLGTPILSGSTWYLYIACQSSTYSDHYRAGYVTVALGSETTAGSYTKHGLLSTFSGNITSLSDGKTYQSNTLTSVLLRDGVFIGYGTCFAPTVPATQYEVSMRSTSTDLVTWTAPTGPLIALGSGWLSISAENPSVVATP